MPKSGESKLKPVLSSVSSSSILTWKKKKKKTENDLSSLGNFASQFLRVYVDSPAQGGEGRESELTRRSHVSVEGLKKADGGEREREREGGGWRLACPRSFTAIPRTHVPVYEWIGTEGGDGRSWKWRRTDFPSSRTRDLSPVRSTPPSPPRLNETRWDRPTNERDHGSTARCVRKEGVGETGRRLPSFSKR